MARRTPKSINFRGRDEPVSETIRVRGRDYFVLEKLSHRGAFRVFDRGAGPGGDYRILYRLNASATTKQKISVLSRMTGNTANRNFPHITDYAVSGGELFVVLSWVWGTNLEQFIASVREKAAPRPVVPEIVRLIRGLTHGLSHLHRRTNLIHGDLSPANIILTSGTTQLVLVDFGSAWPVENSSRKETGDGVTTPYAAPERLSHGIAGDFRSDQFSLSVIAYELLTGRVPYDQLGGQAGLPDLVEQGERSYMPPSKKLHRAKTLPRHSLKSLDEFFKTALALDPDRRFPTHQKWLSAIDELHRTLIPGKQLSPITETAIHTIQKIAGLLGISRR